MISLYSYLICIISQTILAICDIDCFSWKTRFSNQSKMDADFGSSMDILKILTVILDLVNCCNVIIAVVVA